MKAYCRVQNKIQLTLILSSLMILLLMTSVSDAQGLNDDQGRKLLDDPENNNATDPLDGNFGGDGLEDTDKFPADPLADPLLDELNDDLVFNDNDGDGLNDTIPSPAPSVTQMPSISSSGFFEDEVPSLSPTTMDVLGGDSGSAQPTLQLDDNTDGNNDGGGNNGDNMPAASDYPSTAPTFMGDDALSPQPSIVSVDVEPTFSMQPTVTMQPSIQQPPHHTVAPHHTYAPHAGGNHTGNPGNHTGGGHSGGGGNHQGGGSHQGGGNHQGNHQGGGGNHQGGGGGKHQGGGGGNHQGGGGGKHQGGGGGNHQGGGGNHGKHGAEHKHHNGGGGANHSLGKDDVESLTLPAVILVGVIVLSLAFVVAKRVKQRRNFSQVQNDDMNWDLELSTYQPGLT